MLWSLFEWHRQLYPQYHRSGPFDNYLATDVETTGGSHDDLIVSLGHCKVVRSRVHYYQDIILNWMDYDQRVIPGEWVEERLYYCQRSMELKGNFHGVTADVMRRRGLPVQEALQLCWDMYEEARAESRLFVGHNFLNFDSGRIAKLLDEFHGVNWQWRDEEILDTCILEKARLLNAPPRQTESIREYSKRVMGLRAKGVKYKLDACIERHRLLDKLDLNLTERHSAGFDAIVCHYLMCEYKELAKRERREHPTGQ